MLYLYAVSIRSIYIYFAHLVLCALGMYIQSACRSSHYVCVVGLYALFAHMHLCRVSPSGACAVSLPCAQRWARPAWRTRDTPGIQSHMPPWGCLPNALPRVPRKSANCVSLAIKAQLLRAGEGVALPIPRCTPSAPPSMRTPTCTCVSAATAQPLAGSVRCRQQRAADDRLQRGTSEGVGPHALQRTQHGGIPPPGEGTAGCGRGIAGRYGEHT